MATCRCDNQVISDCLDIEPGLRDLPRQYLGFGEFRRNLLEAIAHYPPLAGWSAEGEQDLGVMLLEMWAYVLDISQFYDAKITEEFFLAAANRDISARRLIKLLGYRPRPALSASVTLTAEADGSEPIVVPAATAFRSAAFEGSAAQVFSTLTDQPIRPERNSWRLAPIPGKNFPGKLLFSANDAGIPKRGLLAFTHGTDFSHASHITGTQTVTGPDGRRYLEVSLEVPLGLSTDKTVADLRVRLMGSTAVGSPFGNTYESGDLILDGLYPQLLRGQMAVLESWGQFFVFTIGDVGRKDVQVGTLADITAPASTVTLPPLDGIALASSSEYRLHFGAIRVGRPLASALTDIKLSDIDGALPLRRPDRATSETLAGGFVLKGTRPLGAKIDGTVETDSATKEVTFVPGTGNDEFADDLEATLVLLGNLVAAVRGEKVEGEVLGSADASQPNNRFKLKKSPLSWLEDASAADGISPLLEVRVDGILWHRTETRYTAKRGDRVYDLEVDDAGFTWVVFGDGQRGARPTTGTGNVTATYYHGAGAAKPPAGAIGQIVKPVKGLKRIGQPLTASGGADAEAADDFRVNAPAAALTLGNAVSVQDFTALSSTYPGVLNVSAGWGWDPRQQRAIVSIWVISDGGVDAKALEAWLAARAAPDMPIAVSIAIGVEYTLTISVDVHADYPALETRDKAKAALIDATVGLLAPRNVAIGGVLYRSTIVKAVQTMPGVESVSSIRLGAAEMEWAVKFESGHYPDFVSVTVA